MKATEIRIVRHGHWRPFSDLGVVAAFSDEWTSKKSLTYRSAVPGDATMPAAAGSIETAPCRLRFRRPSRAHSSGRALQQRKSAYEGIKSRRGFLHAFVNRWPLHDLRYLDNRSTIDRPSGELIHPLVAVASGGLSFFPLYSSGYSQFHHVIVIDEQ